MIETITIARPYAKALFELAQEQNTVDEWFDLLLDLSSIVDDDAMNDLIHRPESLEKILMVFAHVLGERYHGMVKNFLTLLQHHHRLVLLPAITDFFCALKNNLQGISIADVETAFMLTDSQQKQLVATLSSHTGKVVRLVQHHCPELIGGVRIKIANNVIDRSIQGLLKAMATQLHEE